MITVAVTGPTIDISSATMSLALQQAARTSVALIHGALNANIGDEGVIGRRTGTLARAIVDDWPVVDGNTVRAGVHMDEAIAKYVAIQEVGGTIVPNGRQALTVPLPAMLTDNGVARGTAADVKDNPGMFGYVATFIPKGHNVIMGTRPGKGAGIVPLFALVPSVTIPAKHYMALTLAQVLDQVDELFDKAAGEAVQVVFGSAS